MGRLVTPRPYDPENPPTWWDRNGVWVILTSFVIFAFLLYGISAYYGVK